MKDQVSQGLIRFYDRATRAGVLDQPVSRRAFESAYLAYKRLIEAGPIDGLRVLVEDGTTVIDVGANIGFFTLRFARWVGRTGRVIAVEPEASSFESLRRRVARAGLSDVVTCVQAAAADRPGDARLAVTPGHPGDHHLADEGHAIPAATLDGLAGDDPRRATLVKIDVQGAEEMVITGARRLIERDRPALFVEVDEESLLRFGSSAPGLVETLVRLGYAGHTLTRSGIGAREDPERILGRSSAGYIDVLFLPEEGRWRV